ncbi:nitroreductase family protein [Sporosarcina sp. NPDC096371]|uniref:nitroreductase family protein n=1 Tax=Sporosarcina sp. NPDC096371 TaxID=3364530 RepID=UPI003827C042
MNAFNQLVMERRSANNFLPNNPITQRELDEIFNVVKMAPSAFNLQHTNYLVVTEDGLKEQVQKAAFGQYKVGVASAVIIVTGDKEAYKNTEKVYEGLLMLGILNQQQYDDEVQDVVSLYESRGEEFQRDEAIRNASLSSMLFMLAAKNAGWATCPMIGFEPDKIKNLLAIPDHQEPVLMIVLGKEKVESRRPRGYRKPVGEFVKYY